MELASKNKIDITKQIQKKIETNLIRSGELIQSIINEFIQAYYDEYDPDVYDRTNQFLHSCVVSDIYRKGESFCIDIYINYNSMYYKISNPWQVVNWANRGLHGGYDHAELGVSEPFSHFWDDAEATMFDGAPTELTAFVQWLESRAR